MITKIKPSNDISGDKVIIDFNLIMTVAEIATGESKRQLSQVMSELDDNFFNGKHTSNVTLEKMERVTRQLKDSIKLLNMLQALKESELRESLYLYNVPCEHVDSMVWDKDIKPE